MIACSVDLTEAGTFTVSIPDAEGELYTYRAEPALPGLSLWAVQLTRADSGESYRVTWRGGPRWACDCPAFTYRKRGAGPCKHCIAGRSLLAFLRAWQVPVAVITD